MKMIEKLLYNYNSYSIYDREGFLDNKCMIYAALTKTALFTGGQKKQNK